MSTTTAAATDSVDAGEVVVWQVVVGRLKAIAVHLPPEWLTDLEDGQLAQLRRFVSQLIERLAAQDSATGVPSEVEIEMRSVNCRVWSILCSFWILSECGFGTAILSYDWSFMQFFSFHMYLNC